MPLTHFLPARKLLRREPTEERKRLLAKLLRGSRSSIVLNEHYEEDGAIVFREACRLGCEGIVSKSLGSILSPRSVATLGEGEKSECASGEKGRRNRIGGGDNRTLFAVIGSRKPAVLRWFICRRGETSLAKGVCDRHHITSN